MITEQPVVSVLVSTYNRSHLLRRAIDSVLRQDFREYELIIVDDCSLDDTQQVVESYRDQRIRYFKNETNVGSKQGDRAILRRCIYELMRGDYFVYLCDDDYWLYPDLLRRQVEAFRNSDDVAMVMGGQLSYFLTTSESYFGRTADDPLTITPDNIDKYFDVAALKSKTHHLQFMQAAPGIPLYSKSHLTSTEFLDEFARDPATKNIIVGATLYSRKHFVRSGALRTADGSKWQAGYELIVGPACYGDVVYFDQPCIVTEIRQQNASFQRTQIDHYLDSIKSAELAFEKPLADPGLADRRAALRDIRSQTIRNISRSFLGNSLQIYSVGSLNLCSEENMERPVSFRQVLPAFTHNRVVPTLDDLTILTKVERAKVVKQIRLLRQNFQRSYGA